MNLMSNAAQHPNRKKAEFMTRKIGQRKSSMISPEGEAVRERTEWLAVLEGRGRIGEAPLISVVGNGLDLSDMD